MLTTLAATILPEQQKILQALVDSPLYFPIAILALGVVFLLFGFRTYKFVVVFNCVALGFWCGSQLGAKAQIAMVAAIVGAVVCGTLAWPLMKYAVALCGGLVGAAVGMVLWAHFDHPPHLAWAGGLAGLILLGMLSFLLFKTSVILFSCLQGAAMLVLGASAIIINCCTPWRQAVSYDLNNKPILMPLLVLAVALLGLIFQQQKHGLLGHEGGPKPGGSSGGSAPKGDAKK